MAAVTTTGPCGAGVAAVPACGHESTSSAIRFRVKARVRGDLVEWTKQEFDGRRRARGGQYRQRPGPLHHPGDHRASRRHDWRDESAGADHLHSRAAAVVRRVTHTMSDAT